MKECQYCGKEFDYRRITKIYCSKSCADKYYRKKNKERLQEYFKRLAKCKLCGEFRDRKAKSQLCQKCWNKLHNTRQNNNMWNGGIQHKKVKNGTYILVYSPNHPFVINQRYVRKHRLVMENKLSRFLKPTEIVHHMDFNPSNNHIDNLHLFINQKEHTKYHVRLRGFVREMIHGSP